MRIIFLLMLTMQVISLYAQTEVPELPVHFGQYFNNVQINPAKSGSAANMEFFTGSRRNNDNFGGIATSFFSSSFRFNPHENGFHVAGIYFNNDKEGEIIRRNRAYGSYARHQKLSEKWFFAAGISLGLYNFSIKSSPAMGGISSNAFDGNGGVWLYGSKTRIGSSVNQFNNAKVQPFDQVIRLSRHYFFTGEQDWILHEVKITPSAFIKYTEKIINPGHQKWTIGSAVNVLVKNIVGFGTSYEKSKGVYTFLSIQNIGINLGENKKGHTNTLNIHLSYFMPGTTNGKTNTQSYELILIWFVNKK